MFIENFDFEKEAVIEPKMMHKCDCEIPETVVGIFSYKLLNQVLALFDTEKIAEFNDIDGKWPVWQISYEGLDIALTKARLGGPACSWTFENCISLGAKRIILLGSAGVLDKTINDCGILIPNRAIRDEGTSFHYAQAADFIDVNRKHRQKFEAMLDELGYSWIEGVTWTTDAIYRETQERINKAKKLGAICVDMECAAMQAVCDFREVDFFQYFYAADNLDNHTWEPRSLGSYEKIDEKVKIALLAFEFAKRLEL